MSLVDKYIVAVCSVLVGNSQGIPSDFLVRQFAVFGVNTLSVAWVVVWTSELSDSSIEADMRAHAHAF